MEIDHTFDELDETDDTDDVMDEMIADSRVVRIIDEMEYVEEDLDYFDETEMHHGITEMF